MNMWSHYDLITERPTYFSNLVKCLEFNLVSGRRNMNVLKQSKISLEIAKTVYFVMSLTIKVPTRD